MIGATGLVIKPQYPQYNGAGTIKSVFSDFVCPILSEVSGK